MDYNKVDAAGLMVIKHGYHHIQEHKKMLQKLEDISTELPLNHPMRQQHDIFTNEFKTRAETTYQLIENQIGFDIREFKLHEYIQFMFEEPHPRLIKIILNNNPQLKDMIQAGTTHESYTRPIHLELISHLKYEDWALKFYDTYKTTWFENLQFLPDFINKHNSDFTIKIKIGDTHANSN